MKQAQHNPFRTPTVTPTSTGASSSAPVVEPIYEPPPGPPPSSVHPAAALPAIDTATPRVEISAADPIGLTEEAPPAYTPAADVYQGESTVEFGPRRPFQRAPPPVQPLPPQATGFSQSSQHLSPQGTGWSSQPQHTGGSWSAYPGAQRQGSSSGAHTTSNPNVSTSLIVPPLPPRPSSQHSRSNSTTTGARGNRDVRPVSDFARDFYAAGAGVAGTEGESGQAHPPARYAPPPGNPPPASPSRSPGGQGNGGIPDDGRPTRTPVPGHPLLKEGQMLVYPVGYECSRCSNTGYKNFDPSHPCRKCWDKHARPYTGALAYAPTGSASTLSANSRNTFQRPLPSFRPPHLNPAVCAQRSRSQRHPSSSSSSSPPSLYSPPLSPRGPPAAPNVHVTTMFGPRPPPDATVVLPGDPRIGGRLCWRCEGRGLVSFLVFDEITCGTCGGIGRTLD